jgi:hypothetical protein
MVKSKTKKNQIKIQEQIKELEQIEKAYLFLANKFSEKGLETVVSGFHKEAADVRKQINKLMLLKK